MPLSGSPHNGSLITAFLGIDLGSRIQEGFDSANLSGTRCGHQRGFASSGRAIRIRPRFEQSRDDRFIAIQAR